MTSIKTISLARLKNDEDYGLHMSVLDFSSELNIKEMEPALKKYAESFESLKVAMDKAQGESTASIAKKADEERDNAWIGANGYLKCCSSYHPVESIKEASKVLLSVFDSYGNPIHLPLVEESSVLDNLIDSLSLKAAEMEAAEFTPWFDHLKAKHASYLEAAKNHATEKSQRIIGAVKIARTNCDNDFLTIVTLANAFVNILDNEALENFNGKVNVLMDKFRTSSKTKATAKANKAVDTASGSEESSSIENAVSDSGTDSDTNDVAES